MTIAVIDPAAGMSGDMTLGALIDVGVDPEWIRSLPTRLGLEDVTVHVERVQRASQAATFVRFDIPGSHDGSGHDIHHTENHHGHHVPELIDRIQRGDLSTAVKQRAVEAFELLAGAEGRVHGVTPDKVHLHEVGAADALLDIVGAIEGFERLGARNIFAMPVATGHGWTTAAHGHLPVPAPATAILLEGLDVTTEGPVQGEAVTPTGAVLLRVLSDGPPPRGWRPRRVGWGAGSRNPDGYANVLRLMVADPAPEAAAVEIIATDIDDMVPEYLESVRQAIFSAGALDCVIWPTHGKKGRMGLRIEAQAPPDCAEAVRDALLEHTTTLGVRTWRADRSTVSRAEIVIQVAPSHPVRVKIWDGSSGPRIKPESDDVTKAAEALGLSALEIADRARRLARAQIEKGEEKDLS